MAGQRVRYKMNIHIEKIEGLSAFVYTPDKDAVLLDCYEHSGVMWFLSYAERRPQFDLARESGVWVPDDCLRDQLDTDETDGKDRRAQAVLYAGQFLESYNAIINGEVYGIVTETYDECGGYISCDHCWGYVGSEDTAEEMKMQFEAACKDDGSCAAGGPKARSEVDYVEKPTGITTPLLPDLEGFTSWTGGECPVAGDVNVEVVFDDGNKGFCSAAYLRWASTNPPTHGNITAYRVVK